MAVGGRRQALAVFPLLAVTEIDAVVQADPVYPGLCAAFPLKVLKAFPQPDQNVLVQVVNFVFVVRKHVADGIDGAFMLSDDVYELLFLCVHVVFSVFNLLDRQPSEKLYFAYRFFCSTLVPVSMGFQRYTKAPVVCEVCGLYFFSCGATESIFNYFISIFSFGNFVMSKEIFFFAKDFQWKINKRNRLAI